MPGHIALGHRGRHILDGERHRCVPGAIDKRSFPGEDGRQSVFAEKETALVHEARSPQVYAVRNLAVSLALL